MIGYKPCRFLVDTGAVISIIKYSKSNELRPSEIRAKSATGSQLKVYGEQKIGIKFGKTRQIYHAFL